jgi:hypothetical protein
LLAHPDVQAEIARLELPQGSVVVSDPWIYGKAINDARDIKVLLTSNVVRLGWRQGGQLLR